MFRTNPPTAPLAKTAALVCLTAVCVSAHAYQAAACLLAGRVVQVEKQPLNEVMLRVHLQSVHDNNTHTNEVECPKVFQPGSSLWVSLHASTLAESGLPSVGDRAWLSLRYLHNGSSVLRKYEWITRKTFLERKDGIQRQSD